MKRLLHVKPTITQSVVDPRFNDLFSLGLGYLKYSSASDAVEATHGKIPLGVEGQPIWDKTFKIRLTSRETCRKLDLNVKFDTKYIRADGCNQVTIVGVPYDTDEEV